MENKSIIQISPFCVDLFLRSTTPLLSTFVVETIEKVFFCDFASDVIFTKGASESSPLNEGETEKVRESTGLWHSVVVTTIVGTLTLFLVKSFLHFDKTAYFRKSNWSGNSPFWARLDVKLMFVTPKVAVFLEWFSKHSKNSAGPLSWSCPQSLLCWIDHVWDSNTDDSFLEMWFLKSVSVPDVFLAKDLSVHLCSVFFHLCSVRWFFWDCWVWFEQRLDRLDQWWTKQPTSHL